MKERAAHFDWGKGRMLLSWYLTVSSQLELEAPELVHFEQRAETTTRDCA